ncbi:hypothetical protein H4R18_005301 [Coemansia javaensis]|uniref:AAA-ATPase-like domain-containing protein n=1 Tax=Coemansia javaensis TaxID=2761396 RepID=A0A9W8LEI3_9FUNG|nr:hypothetical protein H4R18_005301 [Coemansia javaensis]
MPRHDAGKRLDCNERVEADGLSSRSKVHGGNIVTGDSAWCCFIGKNLALVDKSLAILDVMECGSAVTAGLYPRRMGKSTFLDLLRNFLAVVSETSFSKRWERFSEYAINEEPDFSREHFARYAVFKLTMKTQDPTSLDDAAVDFGPYDEDDIKGKVDLNRRSIDDAIKMFDRVMDREDTGAGDIADISDTPTGGEASSAF